MVGTPPAVRVAAPAAAAVTSAQPTGADCEKTVMDKVNPIHMQHNDDGAQRLIRPGLGSGWRPPIADMQAELSPAFVEVLAENMPVSAPDPRLMSFVRGQIPVVTHGVSLSLGSSNRPDPQTLGMLNRIAEMYASPLISEHIALVRAQADPGYDSPHQEVLEAGGMRTCSTTHTLTLWFVRFWN